MSTGSSPSTSFGESKAEKLIPTRMGGSRWTDCMSTSPPRSAGGPSEAHEFALGVRGDLIVARSGKMPREERCKQIRSMLLDYAREEKIPNLVFRQALEVLALPPDELHGNLRKCDDLLRRLLARELGLDLFIVRWVDLDVGIPQPGWRPSPPAVTGSKPRAPQGGYREDEPG